MMKSLALEYRPGQLKLLDQRFLPQEERWILIENIDDIVAAIFELKVRGAPLIGVAAAFALAELSATNISPTEFSAAAERVRAARPTAVNLMWALDRMLAKVTDPLNVDVLRKEAVTIFEEDQALCEAIATHGVALIPNRASVLTHCNTGGLATAGVGTALGVIRRAHELGKEIKVYVDETRPLLQGGRLTTWELEKLGIEYSLICDNMAASLMGKGAIDLAIVGSDRIAVNGDFANKIGTYGVAVLCHHHGIPFYVAAPYSTVDSKCESGAQIPIELRSDDEVRGIKGVFGKVLWAPNQCPTYNPAFDVTPAKLVSHWILDKGVYGQDDIQNGVLKEN